MPKASDLLRQGRHEEIWEMCCGYIKYDIKQFMTVQKRLLLEQIEALNKSKIGKKIFNGAVIQSVEDFREQIPLTTYASYCPELSEKMEDSLPEKPAMWVHTSGRSGEFPCKWVPMTASYIDVLSTILYGIGILSGAKRWGDVSPFIKLPKMMYTVAPRPWISGALASMLGEQTPLRYYPSLKEAEQLPFEERIRMGFEEALSGGIDYFFGLSLILSAVGTNISQSAKRVDIRPLFSRPKALMRLTKGMIKSRIAGRSMLPKDLWDIKGIVTSGLDSSVYKSKIKEYWGRYPLDVYANTEGGVIATQTWDYEGMTFIPNLNFLEFIPEQEHAKWQLDHNYQPKTVLLDEVKAGECYEIVITSLHGGSLVRYRIGDLIRITSLKNEQSGIEIPQMEFERRCDDMIDFATFRLNEKSIWQAIENTGVSYQDWIAYKNPGEMTLNILIEPGEGCRISESELETEIYEQILKRDSDTYASNKEQDYLSNVIRFKLKLAMLPRGSFARYSAQKQLEGADLAHLKPRHISPPQNVVSFLIDFKPLETGSGLTKVPEQKRVRVG
jgi:hypothetical protein